MKSLLLLPCLLVSKFAHAGPRTKRIDCENTCVAQCARIVADLTERSFVIPEAIANRRLTIVTGRELTAEEAFAAFVAALEANSIKTVKTGDLYKLTAL